VLTRPSIISQTILDPKTSRRIFELARDQQDELGPSDAEEDEDEEVIEDDFTRPRTRDLEQLDDDDDDEGEEGQFQGFSGDEEREFVRRLLVFFFLARLSRCAQEIDESDIQALDALHSSNAGERRTLADIIFAKLESGAGQTAVIRASNRCKSICFKSPTYFGKVLKVAGCFTLPFCPLSYPLYLCIANLAP
jgi:essential nuclear protein 1